MHDYLLSKMQFQGTVFHYELFFMLEIDETLFKR